LEAALARLGRPEWRTVIAWIVVLPWLLWVIVRGFGLEIGFPLVPLMAYTPHFAVATIVPLAITLLLRAWVAAEVVAIVGLLLLAAVVPRVTGGPETPEPGATELRVVSANIYRGRASIEQLMEIVRSTDADLLSVQELSFESTRELDRLGLRKLLPYRTQVYSGEYFGGGIFSRYRLRDLQPVRTPPRVKATGELLSMPRAILYLPDGRKADVVAAHPYPPTDGRVREWELALQTLPPAGEGPLGLLIGDFNATLDHDAFRELVGRGYRDAAEVVGDGAEPTWQVGRFFPPPVAIDHVLADDRMGVSDYEVHDLPGSDHEALSATLFVPARGRVR
jgi:endonuclease/exonuclease/phosphatase family metal-dependent hydrolase